MNDETKGGTGKVTLLQKALIVAFLFGPPGIMYTAYAYWSAAPEPIKTPEQRLAEADRLHEQIAKQTFKYKDKDGVEQTTRGIQLTPPLRSSGDYNPYRESWNKLKCRICGEQATRALGGQTEDRTYTWTGSSLITVVHPYLYCDRHEPSLGDRVSYHSEVSSNW